jgi:hypothetical protein
MIDDPSDVAALRQRFPRWHIDASWVTAGTGPDVRLLRASLTLTATTAADLAAQIEQAGQARQG